MTLRMKTLALFGLVSLLAAAESCTILDTSPSSLPANLGEDGSVKVSLSGDGFDENTSYRLVFYTDSEEVVVNGTVEVVGVDRVVLQESFGVNLTLGEFYHIRLIDANDQIQCSFESSGFFVHDAYSLVDFGGSSEPRLNVAGREEITFEGQGFFPAEEKDVVVLYQYPITQETQTTGGKVTGANEIKAMVPPIITPLEWYQGCADEKKPVRSATCVPDINVLVSVSLDGGLSFSNALQITFGYIRPLKIAFVMTSTINDEGWTTRINEGRIDIEAKYGQLIDAASYFERVPEGEFESLQENVGSTIATSTDVPEIVFDPVIGNTRVNSYYEGFMLMKRLCDEDYDFVIAASFGFQKQAFDVSNSYPGCWENGHSTYFLSTGGYLTNPRMSTGFAKIYQMRYLSGLIAGYQLRKLSLNPSTNQTNTCVGYLAAYPLPEVQRGINAFTIGCKEIHGDCLVKVMFTGTWHHAEVEYDSAAFFYNMENCIIITQHSDTAAPQKYFADRGGYGLAYHVDQRRRIGDSVLQSAMINWGPVFSHFVDQILQDNWQAGEQAWLGVDQQAVKLSEYFSPVVEPYFVDFIRLKEQELESAKGTSSFQHIFCNQTNLKKRWVYKRTETSNTVINGCGFQPEWERLATPVEIDSRHFDASGCLIGVDFPGQALLQDAFTPNSGDDLYIFSDFLLEGVELLTSRTTPYGTIHDADDHGCFSDYGTLGDKFFTAPRDYGQCDGSQWKFRRSDICVPETMTTEIIYEWVLDPENQKPLHCGMEVDVSGKYSKIATLPKLSPGVPCDYIVYGSSVASVVVSVVVLGIILNGIIICLLVIFRKNQLVRSTQPMMVVFMAIGGITLNLSTLSFIGKPTEETCLARIWTFNLAFDLVFAFLWARIYRVNLLFKNIKRMKRVVVSDKDTIKVAATLLFFEVIILLVWSIVDPPKPMMTREVTAKLPQPGQGYISYVECSGGNSTFMASAMMYKVLLILSSCYLVFVTKNVPANFVEHKFIIFSAYNTAIFSGVVMLLTFSNNDDPSTALLIHAIGVTVGSLLVIGSLVVPRLALVLGFLEFTMGSDKTPTIPQGGSTGTTTGRNSIVPATSVATTTVQGH